MDIIDDPRIAPHLQWDARRLFKFDGESWVRFYHEPWTGDDWYNIQASLHSENLIVTCLVPLLTLFSFPGLRVSYQSGHHLYALLFMQIKLVFQVLGQ